MAKTILITGSTDGIGKLAALKYANEGHTVFLHGRNAEKLEATISEIKEKTNNNNINGFTADFSSLEDVKKMAEKIKTEVPKLEVLINNAGVYKSRIANNKEGLDMRYVVNYLSPYVLTNMLLPTLKNNDSPRIINLSSAAQASISPRTLLGETNESDGATYAQSKLALLMWSFYLANKEPNVTIIPVNPGSLLATKMVKEAFGKSWSSADKGASILFDLAVSENYKNDSGKYYDNDHGSFGMAHSDAYDNSKIKQLIELTNRIVK